MTERRTGYCLRSSDLIGSVLVSTVALAACEALVGEGPTDPAQSDAGARSNAPWYDGGAAPYGPTAAGGTSSADAGEPTAMGEPTTNPPRPQAPCGQAAQEARAALQTYCAGCHGKFSVDDTRDRRDKFQIFPDGYLQIRYIDHLL